MDYIKKLNKIKKSIILKSFVVYGLIGILSLLPFLKCESTKDVFQCIIIFCFFEGIVAYFANKSIVEKDYEKYKKIFAKNITLDCLKQKFNDVKYDPSDKLLPKDFAKIIDEIKIPTVNSYRNNDYICAKYKKLTIEYSDIVLSYTPLKSSYNIHDNFKGKLIRVSSGKRINVNMQISPKTFGGKKIKQLIVGKDYRKYETKKILFDNKFLVFTDNEEEAKKIINENLIKKLQNLYNKTKGKLFIFIIDNQISIAIGDSFDYFEPNIYCSLEKNKQRILEQIDNLIRNIEEFI